MARPTTYRQEYCKQAVKLCRLGATNKDLAAFFDVEVSTVADWRVKYPEFAEALKEGREHADANVAQSLYRRATGYKHLAFKIMQYEGKPVTKRYVEHYPPDTVACIFWLKNRRPDLWRDRVEHTGKDGKDLIAPADERELAKAIAFILTGQAPPSPDQPGTRH